jgi:hypothetical protein
MRLMPPIALTVVALLFAAVAPVSAQSQLDTPIVRAVDNSRASITLEVEAGETGAPLGFRVQWIRQSDFDALGGWPADPSSSPLVSRAQFYGTPTWNVSTGTYRLQGGSLVRVELGDLFDETGLLATNINDLVDFQDYVFRVQATATGTESASNFSTDLTAATKPASQNCTFTQGYWKNHSSAWPVSSLTLGTVNYTKAQLLQILGQPSQGNGLTILAHQLIAAKLNIAGGADPTPVAAVIAAADAQIGNLVVRPIGSGFLDPDDVDTNSQTLDSYNNGNLGVSHCGSVPSMVQTWGSLKASYR